MNLLRILAAEVAFFGVGILIGGIVVAGNGSSVLLSVAGLLIAILGVTGWIVVALWPAIVAARRSGSNRIVIGHRSRDFHEALRASGDSDAPAWDDLNAGVEADSVFAGRGLITVMTAAIGLVTVVLTIWWVVSAYQPADPVAIGVWVLIAGVLIVLAVGAARRRMARHTAGVQAAARAPGVDARVVGVHEDGFDENSSRPQWRVTVQYEDREGASRQYVGTHLGIPPEVGSIQTIKRDPAHPERRGTTFLLIRDAP